MPQEEQSQQSAEVLSAGLRITITLRGKTIADSVIMMIPNDKEQLVAMIKKIVDGQCENLIV